MIGIRVGEDLQVKSVVGRRRQVGELFVAIGLLVGDPEVQLHGVPGLGLVVVRADGGVMPANGPPWFFGGGMGMVLLLEARTLRRGGHWAISHSTAIAALDK